MHSQVHNKRRGYFIFTHRSPRGARAKMKAGRSPNGFTDPLGLETLIMSEDIPGGFVHLFIAQQDETTGEVTTLSLHPADGVAAGLLTILIPGNDFTVPAAVTPNFESELKAAIAFFDTGELPAGINLVSDPPLPDGMTQERFDAIVMANALGQIGVEPGYDGWDGPNSNTFVDNVIERSGSIIPDVPGAQAQNYGEPSGCPGANQ